MADSSVLFVTRQVEEQDEAVCLANSAAGPPSKDKRLRACLIQEAMWHHHKVLWDIKNDPLWPNSHILQLLAVFSPH